MSTPRPVRSRSRRALVQAALGGGVAIVLVAAVLAQLHGDERIADTSAPTPIALPAQGTNGSLAAEPGVGEAAEEAEGAVAAVTQRPVPDPAWTARVAAATGIPERALTAYASAQLTVAAEDPGCGVGWNTLAGIGSIESDHGRHGGATLGDDGYSSPRIRGAALDGNGVAAIPDTDGGAWDGDTVWDRAVGPMQFIPDTWSRWGTDGDGDGVSDPNDIDDAALAAARYLCASGTMTTSEGWRTAIFSYNHLDSYVSDVAATANLYADRAGASS